MPWEDTVPQLEGLKGGEMSQMTIKMSWYCLIIVDMQQQQRSCNYGSNVLCLHVQIIINFQHTLKIAPVRPPACIYIHVV